MTAIDVRYLKSRQLKDVTAIPWAQPAVAPSSVPYPAYRELQQTKSRRRKGQTRYVFLDLNVLQTVELSDAPFIAAELQGFNFNKGLKRTLLELELNEYPEAPPAPVVYAATVPSGFNYNEGLERKRLDVLELNEFTETPPTPVVYASIVPSGYNYNDGLNRKRRDVLEINVYPPKPTIPGVLPAFYTLERFYRKRVRYNAQSAPDAFDIAAASAFAGWVVQPNETTVWTVQ